MKNTGVSVGNPTTCTLSTSLMFGDDNNPNNNLYTEDEINGCEEDEGLSAARLPVLRWAR